MQDVIVFNQVSARDLNTIHRERERRHKEIYVVVLERIYSRIKRCASVGMSTCWYETPEVIFGYPMFDVDRCIRFSMRHLTMNGFKVSRLNNKFLDICWSPTPPRSTNNQTVNNNRVMIAAPPPTTTTTYHAAPGDMIVSVKRRPRAIGTFASHNIIPDFSH